jgi:transcriptional regulator with XRE-family HTH domain
MQTQSKKPNVGRNVKTIRFIRGNSQLEMAGYLEEKLHRPFSQQLISDIEAREEIEDEELLHWIAEFLKVTPEALQNLDLDEAINVIGNHFQDHSTQQINYKNTVHNQNTFGPLAEVVQLFKDKETQLQSKIDELAKENEKLKKGKRK